KQLICQPCFFRPGPHVLQGNHYLVEQGFLVFEVAGSIPDTYSQSGKIVRAFADALVSLVCLRYKGFHTHLQFFYVRTALTQNEFPLLESLPTDAYFLRQFIYSVRGFCGFCCYAHQSTGCGSRTANNG